MRVFIIGQFNIVSKVQNMSQTKVPNKAMAQLKESIKSKDMKRIREILSSPNATEIVNSYDKDLQTPMFVAGLCEDQQFGLEVINLLLEKGADPYHKEQNQQSIIFYLAAHNKLKILERMLELGYNLNQNDAYGWTPLFFAANKGRLKCAELLIKNGNNVNHLDKNGQTCLFWASKDGHLEMCKLLINRGCDPLVMDKFKKTAATFARTQNHYHVVDYLNMFKKEKAQKIKSNSESIQIDKKSKKKETPKSEYFLVHTAPNGQSRYMNSSYVQQFLKKNSKIKVFLQDGQQLERTPMPSEHISKTCNKILTSLLKRQDTIAFHQPVRWQQFKLLDYLKIVTEPMDYTTMRTKLAYNCYKTEQDFTHDIHLVYDNCIKYNGVESVYGRLAQKLKQQYDHQLIKEFAFFDD